MREGSEALVRGVGIPAQQAARFVECGPELPMLNQELDLPHVTEIELNIGPERAPAVWRKLGELSDGTEGHGAALLAPDGERSAACA